jgi:predicted ATPase/class 3 adenylate cyclase/DNA-binding CsgD family transcriptional regulator
MAERAHAAVTELSDFRDQRAPLPPERTPRPLPTGTVTFLLTDIEGSTGRWEVSTEAMASAVARHYEILDAAVAAHGGVRPIEQGEGDSMVAAFARASDAVAAAVEAQRALVNEPWPEGAGIRVRMALHTGEAQVRDELYYVGPSIIRCARLRGLAHGGQVLISTTTADLLADGMPPSAALLPLGSHRLKDLRQPQRVFQLAHPALPSEFPPLRSLDALPNNLPAQLSSFVGREGELDELAALLPDHRFVTLVGPGGVGKTRLAAQVAAHASEDHPDGVWWIDLAAVSDPEFVPMAVLGALGLGDARGLSPLERVVTYLARQDALVIFDNCEHVVTAASQSIAAVLSECPKVTVIATSREPLGVTGEVTWRVPPLSLPDADDEPSVDRLLRSEAVRLFVERASEARPAFRVDTGNAAAVAAICVRLDGIPLAIELAAARVRALSPQRILDGLGDRFRLLTGGARTALARQQTLQASVEWSHDLLSDAERVLFRRLSAFAGGFTLGAAETVCAGPPLEDWEILSLLSDLVDKSLVVFDGDRYGFLQTVADFGHGQLVASGEADTIRDAHAAHFLAAAEAAAAHPGAPPAEVVNAQAADHDNFRSALQWTVEHRDHDRTLRLVVALTLFWAVRGHFAEGLAWFRRALADAPAEPSALRCRALWGLSHLSGYGMEASGAYGMAERAEAVEMARALGDPALLARPLSGQGVFEVWLAPDLAVATLEAAMAAAREAEDEWALATTSWWLAFFWVFNRDRLDLASPHLETLATIANRSNPYWFGWHGVVIGMAALHQGRLDDARRALEAAVARSHEFGDPMLEAYGTAWLSETYLARGGYDASAGLAGDLATRLSRSIDECRQQWIELEAATVALAQGDLGGARQRLDRVLNLVEHWNIPYITACYEFARGRLALEEGDLHAARAATTTAEAIAAQFASPWLLARAHNLSGRVARAAGEPPAAEDSFHRALVVAAGSGLAGVAAETLECLASQATAGESWAEATRLVGAAEALRDATGQRRWPLDQPGFDVQVARLQAALGDDGFTQAWTEGAALTPEEAFAYAARARGERKRPSTGWDALTPTELEVVALAARGLTNAEIGAKLFITAGTAKVHLSNIYRKLGLSNRAQLTAQAVTRSAIGQPDP